jgi:CelD/BcsL family acetyltransferase involved in cellulose biosynthesis
MAGVSRPRTGHAFRVKRIRSAVRSTKYRLPDRLSYALTSLEVATLTTGEELAALAPEWDLLVRAMPRPSPFLLQGWILPWWRHYGADHELEVHVARRDGRLVAALPLCLERRLGLRRLRFPGGPQAVLGDVLLAPGESAQTGRVLVEQLRRRARHDVLDVYGIPGGSVLESSARGEEFLVIERIESPVLDSRGSWEQTYRAKTSAKTRNTHKRRRRQLAELGRLETRILSRPEEIGAALEDAFRLHRLRWEGRPDGSDFASARGAPFQRDALLTLAREGITRLALLELAGQAIAFHVYLLFAGRMYVYRLAFDPAFARLSPGLVNTLDALAAGIGEGATRVEFLGGAERYKRELADRYEPLFAGVGLPGTFRGRAAAAATAGVVAARKRLKRSERIRRFYFDTLAPVRRRLQRGP